jgi:hypothetical protein
MAGMAGMVPAGAALAGLPAAIKASTAILQGLRRNSTA